MPACQAPLKTVHGRVERVASAVHSAAKQVCVSGERARCERGAGMKAEGEAHKGVFSAGWIKFIQGAAE